MSLCRSVDRSGSSIEFSRLVVVSISLNLSSFIYPPLVLDVTNLSLDIGTQYMVFSFPDVTMTMVLIDCLLIDCLFGKHKQYASHGRYTWQNKLWQYNIDHSK